MKTAFDPDKDISNREKHAVSLAFGTDVLGDANRLDILDVRHDYAEDRFVCYGKVDQRV